MQGPSTATTKLVFGAGQGIAPTSKTVISVDSSGKVCVDIEVVVCALVLFAGCASTTAWKWLDC